MQRKTYLQQRGHNRRSPAVVYRTAFLTPHHNFLLWKIISEQCCSLLLCSPVKIKKKSQIITYLIQLLISKTCLFNITDGLCRDHFLFSLKIMIHFSAAQRVKAIVRLKTRCKHVGFLKRKWQWCCGRGTISIRNNSVLIFVIAYRTIQWLGLESPEDSCFAKKTELNTVRSVLCFPPFLFTGSVKGPMTAVLYIMTLTLCSGNRSTFWQPPFLSKSNKTKTTLTQRT